MLIDLQAMGTHYVGNAIIVGKPGIIIVPADVVDVGSDIETVRGCLIVSEDTVINARDKVAIAFDNIKQVDAIIKNLNVVKRALMEKENGN